jgi:hypothetical protein
VNQFDQHVERLLNEIPYVDYISKFDLEIEVRQNVREFLGFIKGIFDGNPETDKHNNTIALQTSEEKRYFLNSIMSDPIFKGWVNKQTPEDKKLVGDFLKLINAQIAIRKPRSAYL